MKNTKWVCGKWVGRQFLFGFDVVNWDDKLKYVLICIGPLVIFIMGAKDE